MKVIASILLILLFLQISVMEDRSNYRVTIRENNSSYTYLIPVNTPYREIRLAFGLADFEFNTNHYSIEIKNGNRFIWRKR